MDLICPLFAFFDEDEGAPRDPFQLGLRGPQLGPSALEVWFREVYHPVCLMLVSLTPDEQSFLP